MTFFQISAGSLFSHHTHSSVSKQFWQNNSSDWMTVWSLATSQKPTLHLTLSKYFMIKPQDLLLGCLCLHSHLVVLGSLNVTSLSSTLPTASICNVGLTDRNHQIRANSSLCFVLYWTLLSSYNNIPTEKSTYFH